MTALVLLVPLVRQTNIVVRAVRATHISILLPGTRASLRLFLTVRTVQVLSLFVHLILEKSTGRLWGRIDHTDAFRALLSLLLML